jgi:hypothetical protein
MEDNTNTETNNEAKSYTQSEIDRIINDAVKSNAKKLEKQFAEKANQIEKFSKLSETDKMTEELEQLKREKQEFLLEKTLLDNRAQAVKELESRQVPVKYAELLLDPDAEKMFDKIKSFEKSYKADIAAEVKSKLNSSNPKVAVTTSGEITKEQFKAMSIAKQTEIYNSNKELYMQLIK